MEAAAGEVPSTRQFLKLLLRYVFSRHHPRLLALSILSIFLLIAARVTTLLAPISLASAVDRLNINWGTLSLSNVPLLALLGYFAARVGTTLVKETMNVAWLPVSQHASRRVIVDLFANLHALSYDWHCGRRTGDVLSIVNRGKFSIEELLDMALSNIFPIALDLIFTSVYLASAPRMSWYYAALMIGTLGVYALVTILIVERRKGLRSVRNAKWDAAEQVAVDSLLNFETVKAFGAERQEAERYGAAVQAAQRSDIPCEASLAGLNAAQAVVLNLGLLLVMLLAARDCIYGNATAGDFVAVNLFLLQLAMPLSWLGSAYSSLSQSLVDATEMLRLIAKQPDVRDVPGAHPLRVTAAVIEFRDVTFAYPSRAPAEGETACAATAAAGAGAGSSPTTTAGGVSGVSFRVQAGQTLAIVGATGSGKSTLCRLLLRYYDVDGGAITIDGQDIRQVQQMSLRQAVGVVPQDTVLLNDTIAANIAFGSPHPVTTEGMDAAARAAQLLDRISAFPDGYATLVGERGLRLSGGEKQRVAIARVLLRNPRIVLLDEATSALDTETERGVQAALAGLRSDRACIVIAHRLTTIADADEILVMRDGRVVERGKHGDLLLLKGEYARLWDAQRTAAEAAAAAAAAVATAHAAAAAAAM